MRDAGCFFLERGFLGGSGVGRRGRPAVRGRHEPTSQCGSRDRSAVAKVQSGGD